MLLHNYESDDTRLGRGLGRTVPPPDATDYLSPDITINSVNGGGGGEYASYEDVTDSPNEVPASAIRTLSDVSTDMLPALNFATGAASCVDCTTSTAGTTAPAATAAATAAAVVTPMPAAPTTVNYLLIAVGLGLGYALLKGGSSGLGCAPEPQPTPAVQHDLGRPPRKPKAGLKHVDTLEV